MAKKIKTSQNKNLKNKFRFVILNDETFEEKFSLSLTRRNVWVFIGVTVFTLIFLTAAVIIYTPLKYFIPGFGDYNFRSEIVQLKFKTDSLEDAMKSRDAWLQNVMAVASGTADSTRPAMEKGTVDKSQIKLNEVGDAEMELRKQVEDEANYALSTGGGQNKGAISEIKQLHLMKPVEGYVTEDYDAAKEHFGLDIAAKTEEPVKATLDGKIVSATYTLENGYVIAVQHTNNLISIYKHNARLLKKEGESVKAGDVIAFAGNTGENSTGPHLHFELWMEGRSLNPKDYIVF